MKEDLFKISDLIYREFLGELSETEREELFRWVNSDITHKRYYEKLFTSYSLDKIKLLASVNTDIAWEKWNQKSRKKSSIFIYAKYAAIFILLAGVSSLLYFNKNREVDSPIVATGNIEPGKASATLVIDGRERIVLGKNIPADIRFGEDVNIVADSSNLFYEVKAGKASAVMHTLEVPRRGEFFIILSDSTRVWVNSETRLSYPSYFDDKKRIVELDGEAYFEVHKDRSRPFIVRTKGVDVEVLGTSFNVNAYNEVPEIVTTLVEGKVKVQFSQEGTDNELVLDPGMQSWYNRDTRNVRVKHDVDTRLYTAWTKGYFMYDNIPLEDMMRDLCRWYNVEVVYEDPEIRNLQFTGEFKRYDNFEFVLKFLQLTKKVGVRIDGNVIYMKSL